jgi:hypothetical protein
MTTVSEFLAEKYDNFLIQATQLLGNKIVFPTQEELDLADLLSMFEICFPNDQTEVNLLAILHIKNVKVTKLELKKLIVLVNEILEFVNSIKNL